MTQDDFFGIKWLKEHIKNRKKTVNKCKVDYPRPQAFSLLPLALEGLGTLFVPPAYHDFYKDLEKAERLPADSGDKDESVQSDEDRESEDASDSDAEGG